MSDRDEDDLVAAAVVSAAGIRREVLCYSMPAPHQLNLLYALGEHVNRPISIADLCHRLRITENNLKVTATLLRRKLHYDWLINTVPDRGMRLIHVGGPFADAPVTRIEISREALVKAPISELHKERIRHTLWLREDRKYIDPKYLVGRSYSRV